jgi:hypothetical protein
MKPLVVTFVPLIETVTAPVAFQLNVVDWPDVTVDGLDVKELITGRAIGIATFTVA